MLCMEKDKKIPLVLITFKILFFILDSGFLDESLGVLKNGLRL